MTEEKETIRSYLNSLLEIEILLEVLRTQEISGRSPALKEAVDKAILNGLIIRDTQGYGYLLTEKGEAFVSMIFNTPYPVEKTTWVDPRKA